MRLAFGLIIWPFIVAWWLFVDYVWPYLWRIVVGLAVGVALGLVATHVYGITIRGWWW